MQTLTKLDWEILDATADDWENLEQIYQSLCFDFSPDQFERAGDGAFYFKPAKGAPLLQSVADGICALAHAGLLEPRLEGSRAPVDLSDPSFVWRAWFRMTPEGRQAWDTSKFAAVAEREAHG